MNRSYRVVWNAVLNVWQAASELTKAQGKGKTRTARRVVALGAGALALSGAQAGTLPTGGQIVGGIGSIGQAGNAMTVQQGSDKLAIDWQSFSIGKDNLVRFIQPGADAIALNRVLGQDVSVIQGALQANGKVFLVNPNGILFTPGAQVDVGGILASTLKISTEDFLAGNYRFSGDSNAAVVNQGSIRAADGGLVALIAARVINEGDISAPKGDVLLAAGSKVKLDLGGPVALEVEQGALDALIENGGAIRADAGNILLTARAAEQLASTVINTTGLIEAKSLEIGQDGTVTLSAAGGGVNVAGTVDVSSSQAKGGKVVVTGTDVNVASGARISATGATGGGEIYVGGGWQGKDTAIAQATRTRIAEGAVLDASATVNGDGGTVVAWSDIWNAGSVTQVDGTLRARGGAQGGDGGRIETSGASLGVSQAADASAANGKGGLWLLDPDEVTVASTGGAIGDATVSHGAINAALGGGTNVDIHAANKIDWQEDFQATVAASGARLKLQVDNNVDVENLNTGIFLNGGIDARGAGNGKLDVVLDGNVRIGQGKDIGIHSNGGDVLFGAYVDSISPDKALAGKLRITAADGTVTFADMVGGTNALDALYVTTTTNGKTYINGAIVRTHNEQVYESPVELGTVQFVNPDFEEGTNGWTITDGRFITGSTAIDGWTSPKDTTYPSNNGSQTDNGNVTADFSHGLVAGNGGGKALQLASDADCVTAGYCVIRGGYVVSNSTVSLAKGDTVSFDWSAAAGGDAHDVFGYLLNVKTGEAKIILNDTGTSSDGAQPWQTVSVKADKAGTYKFVFVSGSYDFTGGKVLGASLSIDNIVTTGGQKGLQGSSISIRQGVNATDNNLTFKTNEIDLNGPVIGTGKLAFETLTPTTNIEVGGARGGGGDSTTDGTLKLSNEDIAALGDGFKSVRVGDSTMKGNISIVEDSRFNDDLILNAGTGNIAINAGLTVKDVSGIGKDDGHNPVIVLESKGGTVTQQETGALDAGGLVLLGDGATHDLDNADNRIGTIASDTGSVSYGVAPGQTLTVGTVTTREGQTYTGMVNERDTSLTADEIDIAATISTQNGGTLALKQKTPGLDIHLGGPDTEIVADGDPLRLSQADLDNVKDGFGKIAIGDGNTRNITVDANTGVTLKDDVALTAGGKFDLQGNLSLVDPQGKDEDDTIGNGLVLTVDARQGATQADGAVIQADELALRGDGEFALGRGAHEVGVIAADVGGLDFTSGGALTVGTVDGTTGITSEEAVALRSGGALDIQQGITVTAGTGEGGSDTGTHHDGDRTSDTITLEAAGPVTQGVNGKLDAHGLALLGGDGIDYALDRANNRIDVIASDAGKVNFNNTGNAEVGTLSGKKADGTSYTVVGVDNSGDVSIKTDGDLSIGEQLASTGNVFLNVGGKTTQDAEGSIRADGLALSGGDYALNNAGNIVGDIASDAGKVSFTGSGGLKVGTLTETDGNGNVVREVTGVNNTGDVSIATNGNLSIGEQLASTGNVFLDVAGKTTQDAEGVIKANGLALSGGDYALNNGGNTVGDIASNAGKVSFTGSGDLKVGTLTETDGGGNVVRTVTGVNNSGDVSIATNGNLSIEEQLASTGNVFLNVGGKTTQDAEGVIKANGLALSGGDYALNNGGNIVGDIASDAGKVSFTGSGNLKVGKLTETDGNGNVVRTVTGVNNTGDVSIATNGNLSIEEQLASTGNVFLNVGGKTTQDAEGVIKANGLALSGGDYALNNGGNIVGDIASNAGKVSFTGSGDLKVGTLTETDGNGNVVRTVTGVNNSGDVSINTAGSLTIDEQLASSGNVFLNVGGKTSQDSEGVIKANGLALTGGDYALNNGGNIVGDIASNAGKVSFTGSGDLKVGTLTETDGNGNVVRTVTGVDNTGDVSIATNGNLSIGEQLASTGNVFLDVAGKTTQDAEGVIKADGLALSGGDYVLNNGGNIVGDIASDAGKVSFTGSGDLKVGKLTETDGNGTVVRTLTGVNNTGDVSIATNGNLSIEEQLSTTGNVFLNAGGKTTQGAEGVINANGLALIGGDYVLNNGGNIVGNIASDAGKVSFANSGNLKVGTLTETDGNGDTVRTVTGVNNTGDVSIATNGNLSIEEQLSTTGNVFLNAGGKTTQGAEGVIKANGLALSGGDYALNNGGNTVGNIASDAGKVSFANSGNLKVGTLTETDGNGNHVRTVTGVNNTGDVSIATHGDLSIEEQLSTTGNVFLNAGGKTTQDAEGVIKADGLALRGGDYVLNNGGNIVGDIASDAGKVSFTNSGNLKVGTLIETDGNGDTVRTVTGVNNTGDVSIATNGNLSIEEQLSTTGNVFLNAGGKTTQGAEGVINANGLALIGGDYVLNNGGNTVGDIASTAGKVNFANSGNLKVGTLTETDGNGNHVRTVTGVNNTGDVSIATHGDLSIEEQLSTTGNVFLNAGGKTTQDAEGVIKANGLALTGGDYALNNGGNLVGDIASDAGKVSFTNSGNLKVGTLTETDGNGNDVRTVTGVNNTGDVSINTDGNLTIDERLASSGNVFLNVGGKTTQDAEGVIKANGLGLTGGDYALNNGGNTVGDIASNAGKVSFTGSGDLKVGTLIETDGNGDTVRTVTGVNNTGDVSIATSGNLSIEEQLASTGNVFLNAGGKTTQDAEGVIKANGLALSGGDYVLNNGGNIVGDIASDAGKVSFTNSGNLKVGTLTETDGNGNDVRTVTGVNNTGDVSIATNGDLSIGEQLSATGNVFLNVGGKTTQDTEGVIKADGLALSGGDYALNNGGNIVGDIASDAGKVSVTNSGNLKVGTLTETDGNGNDVRTVTGVNNTGDVSINTDGNLTIDEQLASSGNVFLNVGGKTTQDAEGVIKANGLGLTGGDYTLNNGGNTVGDIASTAGKVNFANSGDLKVGTLTETDGNGNHVRTVTGVNNTGDVSIATHGDLSIEEQLSTTGNVFLNAGGKTTQDAEGVIKANGLALTGGDYALNNGGNLVGDIASDAGKVSFTNSGNLKVGTLTETDGNGNDVRTVTGVNNTGDVSINTDGNLTIEEQLASSGNVFLNVGGKTTQDAEGVIKANGLGLTGGDYALNNGGNTVGDIASNAGKVSFTGSGDLKVGTLIETDGNGDTVRTVTGVNNTGDVSIATNGNLSIEEQLASTGNVFLNAGGKTTQDAEGVIKANGLALSGGDYALNNGGNFVGDIASNAGKVSFANSGDLKVGTLTETDGNGNVVRKVTGVNNTGDVSINTAGSLTIDELLASTGNVFLNVGGKTTQDAEGVIKANGLALTGGHYALNNGGNIVGDIASNAGKVSFANSGDLKVGTLTETDGNGNVVREVTGVNNAGDVSIATNGNLSIGEQLASTGNVFLDVAGKTTQDAEGVIKANGLALNGGDYALNNAGNIVGDIASNAGKVSFANSGDLKVGTLTETDGNGNVVRTVTGVNNTGDVSIATNGNLSIGEQLATTGNVFLDVAGKTTQDAEGVIKANGLALSGGDYALNNGGNTVGDIASNAGKVSFTGSGDLKVGTLTETDGNGNVVRTVTGVNNTGDVGINTAGSLTIDEQLASSGNVFLNVGGKTTQDAEGVIKANGLALTGGDYALNNGGNIVRDIASTAGKVSFANSGDLKVGTLTETDGNGNVVRTVTGVNNTGDVSVAANGNLSIEEQLASTGNVFLDVGGKTTQDASKGGIRAAGLALKGGDFDLDDGSNLVGQIASRARDLSFAGQGDLTIGALTEYAISDGAQIDRIVGIANTGKVRVTTPDGDIAVTQNVATTSNAADAIVLNAGAAHAAGDATGGDVIVAAGRTIEAGAGGRAVIYTGSVAGSAGVVDAVGSGTGNFRYNSSETESNFGRPLGATGTYAIYREQPKIVVSTNGQTTTQKLYDGKPVFDGGGMAGFDVSGLVNGDLKAMLGDPTYRISGVAPGSYPIDISLLNELGYAVQNDPNNAMLTVRPSQTYDSAIETIGAVVSNGVWQGEAHGGLAGRRRDDDYAVRDRASFAVTGLNLVQADAHLQAGTRGAGGAAGAGGSAAIGGTDSASGDTVAANTGTGDGEAAERGAGRPDCVAGQAGACAQYGPQPVFVVRGGVRLPE